MMDNKLSELSKPVGYFLEWRDEETGEKEWCECSKKNGDPLYSQEYVSALDGVAQFWIGESAGWKKRAEDAEKRIAELEEEFAFIMGQNDGMEKELRDKDARIEHLEAKLATPVRLPQLCGDGDNDSEYTEGLNDGITQSAIYLRRQGFTVEGDE